MRVPAIKILATAEFEDRILKHLSDLEYWTLQEYLAASPESGKLIPSSGGLRKLRWGTRGRGKSGGIRVIYYYKVKNSLFLLDVYAKNEKENLSPADIRALAKLLEG